MAVAAVFWGLRLTVHSAPAPAGALAVTDTVSLGGDMTRLFGQEATAQDALVAPTDSRFKLIGVMAAKPTTDGPAPGIALIAIDDKPARPFIAGSRIDERLVLKTVSQRSASLGPADGPATVVLEIPPFAVPATGSLPMAPGIDGVSNQPAPTMPAQMAPSTGEAPQFAPRPNRPVPGAQQ
jgi:general secretion pathway protein C